MSFIRGIRKRWAPLAVLAIAVVAAAVAMPTVGDAAATGTPQRGLHVSGNRIIDSSRRQVVFQGVNRSGTEYACVQGHGVFDGPSDAASVRAIASWHVNMVRVLLNEDCWLGINGINPVYAGANYRRAIVNYVQLLHRYGMYAEVSLIWGAPGSYKAAYQPGGPDEDHAPAVWAGMAATFKNDPNVILAPWGETVVDANCFLKGGVCHATYGPRSIPYRISGMQQAVTVMRNAGYGGIIGLLHVSCGVTPRRDRD